MFEISFPHGLISHTIVGSPINYIITIGRGTNDFVMKFNSKKACYIGLRSISV